MFGISGPENFWYTNQSQCLQVDGIDDIKDYQDTLESMNVIGLSQDEQIGIHRVLALILWIGNVQFTEADNNSSFVTDADVTDFVAYLLEADSAKLEKTLISRIVETKRGGRRGSVYEVPLNPDQALSVRDALAKAFYDRLFEWIIERINIALKQGSGYDYTIGVLDIYGFEIFDHNSFEQLCINYVNEKLQQIFIELTLKAEQEEYVNEQIQWTPIKFFNNKIVCDLIEEKRPPGIFAAMNDAVATAHADPSAADNSFVQKLSVCSSNPHLEQRGNQFIIKHYAGDVSYNVQGMTDKNKDQLSKDILELCQSSENSFIRNLFPDQVDQDSKRRPPTASDRIKSSAGALVKNLMQCQPSYIRCIKPNQTKSPKDYDQKMSLHQIKYLGLCENIRVRRAGFAYRQTFEKFVERFFLLSKRTGYAGEYIWRGDAKQGTKAILEDINIPKEEWQLGVTKAFIRHPETLWSLESLRDKYWHTMATRIQRAWRAFLQYRHDCATKIQRCFRKNKDQMEYAKVRDLGHSLLGQRKERRRMSLISMRRFSGDYLGLNLKKTGEAMRTICGISGNIKLFIIFKFVKFILFIDKDTVFSFKVEVLMPRPLRSSKPLPRILVMVINS
jgi:myosin-1